MVDEWPWFGLRWTKIWQASYPCLRSPCKLRGFHHKSIRHDALRRGRKCEIGVRHASRRAYWQHLPRSVLQKRNALASDGWRPQLCVLLSADEKEGRPI